MANVLLTENMAVAALSRPHPSSDEGGQDEAANRRRTFKAENDIARRISATRKGPRVSCYMILRMCLRHVDCHVQWGRESVWQCHSGSAARSSHVGLHTDPSDCKIADCRNVCRVTERVCRGRYVQIVKVVVPMDEIVGAPRCSCVLDPQAVIPHGV